MGVGSDGQWWRNWGICGTPAPTPTLPSTNSQPHTPNAPSVVRCFPTLTALENCFLHQCREGRAPDVGEVQENGDHHSNPLGIPGDLLLPMLCSNKARRSRVECQWWRCWRAPGLPRDPKAGLWVLARPFPPTPTFLEGHLPCPCRDPPPDLPPDLDCSPPTIVWRHCRNLNMSLVERWTFLETSEFKKLHELSMRFWAQSFQSFRELISCPCPSPAVNIQHFMTDVLF